MGVSDVPLDGSEGAVAGYEGAIEDGIATCEGGFVVASRTGVVRRLASDGELLWRFEAGDAVGALPAISGDHVLVVTRAGCVICLAR